ncbi:MAG: hypothetical protein IJ260_09235 [Butyrivibrio sp.]|nr:hypothetical protein [Butyrivibrio sp.]MBQ8031691.1 hypothetical protein [Butyrivibrio sp.]MBR1643140.1 hypothetical protein [Butyrivibrio sp.]
MEQKMKLVGRDMSIKMGITMSLFLSLIGTLTSGHFTIPGFLISFVVSTIISLIIGFVIPMGKVSRALLNKFGLIQGTLPARCLESFVSDLIYTPIMTFVMVFMAYQMAMKQSGGMAGLNFGKMFLGSLIICFIAGFVIIFIIQPLFMRQTMKKYGKVEKED